MDAELTEHIQKLYSIYPKPEDTNSVIRVSRIHDVLKPVLMYLCEMNGQCFPPLSKAEREAVALARICPRCQNASILSEVYRDEEGGGVVHLSCYHCDWETNELLTDMKEAGYYNFEEYF